MKTILVPTDFSKEASHALEAAVVIAKRTGASIQVLHVIQTAFEKEYTTHKALPSEMKEKLDHATTEVNRKMESKIKSFRQSGVAIEPYIKVGSVFKHVSEIIAAEKIDLIVMGTRGASGLLELLDGSNTERVVRYAKSLVLTVPKKVKDFTIKQVVLATDFKNIPQAFVERINQLQESFRFHLHILYVNTPLSYQTTFAIEKQIQAFLEKNHFRNFTTHIIDEYSVEDGITGYCKKTDTDLIAMATHGRTGLAHLLNGSVTENVVNHAHMPVLTYHGH